ncbi:hypothetical protein Tco_0589074 [Tanacetum coccineum]
MKFSCVIGYKHVIADLLPSLPINLMSKSFYYSIIGDKDERESHAGTLIDIPVFVRSFSIISGFTIIDDDDMTKDVVLGMRFCKKYASCQRIMMKFALGDRLRANHRGRMKSNEEKCQTKKAQFKQKVLLGRQPDPAETMIWYMLEKICVELIRGMMKP